MKGLKLDKESQAVTNSVNDNNAQSGVSLNWNFFWNLFITFSLNFSFDEVTLYFAIICILFGITQIIKKYNGNASKIPFVTLVRDWVGPKPIMPKIILKAVSKSGDRKKTQPIEMKTKVKTIENIWYNLISFINSSTNILFFKFKSKMLRAFLFFLDKF